MKKKYNQPKPEHYSNTQIPAFGYELLRSALLPEILGEEMSMILYWSGRNLARKYPLSTIDDLIHFFDQAGWGRLELIEKAKSKMTFHLHSDLIQSRIKDNPEIPFTLESGFLAEQIQTQQGFITETYTEVKNGKDKKVIFLVRWDNKDRIESTDD
ncbi:DUF2507 domain-containing protein [Terrilactibacillus sp. BCM23-1]|uniref:DUF2507 domain-containing protein n=1 Tax=Terrilactibacillus tamarindi TaxID=2599694 RepID=A0A6N8CNN4_9BACI|nr:YslB family protein [Terrilactibacillus tamarindi]MTT31702.1 DUF2507 domain-containing protein [Terrilactibacillus tamarindi]